MSCNILIILWEDRTIYCTKVKNTGGIIMNEFFNLKYDEGLFFENNIYKIKIPDGFKIIEGLEGRDFVAYLKTSSSFYDSPVRIFSGTEMPLPDNMSFQQFSKQISKASAMLTPDLFTEWFMLDTKNVKSNCSRTQLSNFHPTVLMNKTMKSFRIDVDYYVSENIEENVDKCKKVVTEFIDGITVKPTSSLNKYLRPLTFEEEAMLGIVMDACYDFMGEKFTSTDVCRALNYEFGISSISRVLENLVMTANLKSTIENNSKFYEVI